MKVFIHYQIASSRDVFEGSRLRKTLKGECECAGIEWVDSIYQKTDIAHFLSPRDDSFLLDTAWYQIPVVVSAFYAENDPCASFLDSKHPKEMKITTRSLHFLNKADLVLVPNEEMKELCLKQGVTTRVEVHEPSVSLVRFKNAAAEEDIFPRYFSIRPNQKIVVSTGDYGDRYILNKLTDLAYCCPELDFYFFGSTRQVNSRLTIARLSRKSPSNLHFESLIQDDVFRSALSRADAYLVLDAVHPDCSSTLDAFASKTQVVALHKNPYNPFLVDGETAFVFEDIAGICQYLRSLYSKEAKSTIISEYAVAESHSLQVGAERLQKLYDSVLNQ